MNRFQIQPEKLPPLGKHHSSPDEPEIQDTISYYFTGHPRMTIIFQFFARLQTLPALACLRADGRLGAGS